MRDFTPADSRHITAIATSYDKVNGYVQLTGTAPNGRVFTAQGTSHKDALTGLQEVAEAEGYTVIH